MRDLVHHVDPLIAGLHQLPGASQKACQTLISGNRDFVRTTQNQHGHSGTAMRDDVPLWGPRADGTEISAQAPFAAVLGCADARVPVETVFGKGRNELFVVRVAGNVLGQESLGSLHYAISHLASTLKILVVLAHTNCGAVSEAVDVYLDPRHYAGIATDHSLGPIVDHILVAVRTAAIAMEHVYGSEILSNTIGRAVLLDMAVPLNAAWSAYCLREELRPRCPDLGVVFAVCDLASCRIGLPFLPSGNSTDEECGLFAAPESIDAFNNLAYRMCNTQQVETLLQQQNRRPGKKRRSA